MNDYRKFVMILKNNKIDDYENYITTKLVGEHLYAKNKISELYYKFHVLGKEVIKRVTEEEASLISTHKHDFKPTFRLMYEDLEPWKSTYDDTSNNQKSLEESFFDNYNFKDDKEKVGIESLPKPDPTDFNEEFEKELQKLKQLQEEALKGKEKFKHADRNKDKPQGWHLMKVYVDSEGNVFHKGKEKPDLKGTLPQTIIKEP
jgi:hypothetical protein